jgi:hypothetical protein
MPAHIWARTEETRMAENNQSGIPRWAVALSGVAVAVVAVAAIQLNSGGPAPSPDPTDGGVGGGVGMCIQYSIEELKARDFAFDGTFTALNGDQATFTVNTAFWGVVEGMSITLTAGSGMTSEQGIALDGGPLLVAGERYLISGDDIYAWTCGYSLVYDPAVAAEWAAAAP